MLLAIPSVPFLEALLLLRSEPDMRWEAAPMAARLYSTERIAADLLELLHGAGFALRDAGSPARYRYRRDDEELNQRVDELAEVYANQLVEVTELIHSRSDRKAQQFADAFTWRKDR